jgi:hypothetical protein
MSKRTPLIYKLLLALAAVVLLAVGLYFVPPIHEKLAWRLNDLRTNGRSGLLHSHPGSAGCHRHSSPHQHAHPDRPAHP